MILIYIDYINWHPISQLSNIEKVLEKLIYGRACTFHPLITKISDLQQFGFRQQYSTSDACLINITENIEVKKTLDHVEIGCGAFLA